MAESQENFTNSSINNYERINKQPNDVPPPKKCIFLVKEVLLQAREKIYITTKPTRRSMDFTFIKIEPGTSAEESAGAIFMETDINNYPFIKNECSESISENNSVNTSQESQLLPSGASETMASPIGVCCEAEGETSPTEHSNLERVTIKTETENKENTEISYSEINTVLPDIKKERSEHSETIYPTAGETSPTEHSNLERVTIQAETENKEKTEISYSEIDTVLSDIKKERSEHSEIINATAGAALNENIGAVNNIISGHQKRSGEESKKSKSFPCSKCDRKLASRPNLLAHLHTHKMERPFSCSYCNSSFSKKAILISHIRIHTKEKPFSCFYCSYSFSQKSKLIVHIRIHTKEKPFSCSYCSYSFSQKSRLTVHIRTHTKEKPFSCSYCRYSFSSKSNLTEHKLIHTKEKPFLCSDCSYSCSRKSHLTSHKLTHSKEKPFSCSYCSYSCSRKSSLTHHIRTHTKEKPFSCSYCSYSCSQKSSLPIHIRTHTKEKPFSCSVCSYSCSQKSNLTYHKLTHTKKKPFSCSHCSYSCIKKASLIGHIRTHTT